MRLDQVCRAPQPFDPARGAAVRALFAELSTPLQELIEGVAGGSAYLANSLRQESEWVKSIAQDPVLQRFNDLLSFDTSHFQALSDSLRIAKRRGALLIALADIGGLWPLQDVTHALTRLADAATATSLQFLVDAEAARGKLKADPRDAAGMFVLAMGKMGAYELNYSSDIDLIVLFDESRHAPEHWGDLRAVFIRITKRLIKLLSENTALGYVFRTDLRLRPDASVTPVCIATEPAERYYESMGRTWERAAFIKARACAGDIDAGKRFLARLKPFVWRRQLDFAAIEDAHDMRLRIKAHKKLHGPAKAAGHNLKLGQGGIREIEFFAQTQQLIFGGKNKALQVTDTIGALRAQVAQGLLPDATAEALIAAYRAHRSIEHRIQMMDDAQTHIIPENPEKRLQLALLCGFSDLATFETDVEQRLWQVHSITEAFFNDSKTVPEQDINWQAPDRATQITQGWLTYPALRSERARRIFSQLKPQILSRMCRGQNPDEALLHFDSFLRGLPSGVQVFAMFKSNPELLDMLIDICTMAPDLATYLGKNARVLEAVIDAAFFKPIPEITALKEDLNQQLKQSNDYEQALDTLRIWAQDMRFRVGVQLLRGITAPQETARAYSDIAEACVAEMFDVVVENFSKRHGPPPGQGAAVIAMGKLGSREMTVSSDIDLIVIYDARGETHSQGKKPLPTQTYFARFTQALVSALTVSTSKGGLYEVDMRLRPSGRQGPVATSLSAFNSYQSTKAWTWEHMALLRSRVIVGPIRASVQAAIAEVLSMPREEARVLGALKDMRARLAQAKSGAGVWDIKNGAGGLMDLELLLQAGGLLAGAKPGLTAAELAQAGWLGPADSKASRAALVIYQKVQQASRLAMKGVFDPQRAGAGASSFVAKTCEAENIEALEESLAQTRHSVEKLIEDNLRGR
jgi:glutamate-ammonia-ligase adenylyltransferase